LIKHDGELSITDIQGYISQHQTSTLPTLRKLKAYYDGKHDILNRTYDTYKPDARLVNNHASYICDISSAYFMGSPVTYSGEEKEMEVVDTIFRYNDEADTNAQHALNMAIYGVSYEVLYIDKESMIDTRFCVVSPEEIFVIYDYSLDPQPIAAVRYYTLEYNNSLYVEVYGKADISTYKGGTEGLMLTDSTEHFFGDVPVIEYVNNQDRHGDFTKVLSLIDAYNNMESDTLNDFAYFSDAYLFLSGAEIDTETALQMRENRIINIDDASAKAEFLVKNINSEALEAYKSRIINDIHKLSYIPNLTDEAFAGNLSGVAIKYKILALENLANKKERKFKKALQRRLELLFNLNYTRGIFTDADYTGIQISFSRSLPQNLLEESEMAMNFSGILSKETLLSSLSLVDDVSAEMEKIQTQKENGDSFFDFISQAEKDMANEETEV